MRFCSTLSEFDQLLSILFNLTQQNSYTMSKNKGDYLERIVEMLERSLTQDGTVDRIVHLPIIGSTSDSTAQCDVVIRSGPPHRQTPTIVEVQDRKSPVDIGDF